jgi:hypothetical protein
VSGLTRTGMSLRKIYGNRRFWAEWLSCYFLPCCAALLFCDALSLYGFWFFPVNLGLTLGALWAWRLHEDWRVMSRRGMLLADRIAAYSMFLDERRFVALKMRRRFPRVMWVLVVADLSSVHLYQGFSLFRREPPSPERILGSRLTRQLG